MFANTRLGLVALALALPLGAQSSLSNSFYKSFGNSWLGGYVSGYASLRSTKTSTFESGSVYARGSANGRFLKRSISIASATFNAYRSKSGNNAPSGTGNINLRLAGRTVFSRSFPSSGSASYSRMFDAFSSDPSASFSLGPANITVRGNLGVGVSASVRYSFANTDSYVNGYAYGRGWGYGRASAKVNIVVAGFKAWLDTNVANQTLTLSGTVRPTGVTGRAVYTLRAIALKIRAEFRILFVKWKKTLVDYQSNQITKVLFG